MDYEAKLISTDKQKQQIIMKNFEDQISETCLPTTCIHCFENEIDEELSNELCTDCFYEYEKQQERNFINDQFNF